MNIYLAECREFHFYTVRKRDSTKWSSLFTQFGLEGLTILPTPQDLPSLLLDLFESKDRTSISYRANIRAFNNSITTTCVETKWVPRCPEYSLFIPILAIHGELYHSIGGMIASDNLWPCSSSVYIHGMNRIQSKCATSTPSCIKL